MIECLYNNANSRFSSGIGDLVEVYSEPVEKWRNVKGEISIQLSFAQ